MYTFCYRRKPISFCLRAVLDRSVPQGAPVAASEQLQPVYETKTMVQQNGQLLQAIEKHLKVRCGSQGDIGLEGGGGDRETL